MSSIDCMLSELAKIRQDEQKAKEIRNKAQQALEQTEEWKKLENIKNMLVVFENKSSNLETTIREAALAEYAQTKAKNLGGVQIKIFTKLEYDENAAINYCLEHKHANLLKLDKRGFEKVAKELRPDFVVIKDEPSAQIASDLNEYL